MNFEKKKSILQGLNTKDLIAQLKAQILELEKVLLAKLDFEAQNHDYIAGTGDCSTVKRMVAELVSSVEGKNAQEREAWLTRQRLQNETLSKAIIRQREVSFLLEDHIIRVEMARRKYDSLRAVLGLRTAQINFLAGSEEQESK